MQDLFCFLQMFFDSLKNTGMDRDSSLTFTFKYNIMIFIMYIRSIFTDIISIYS